ncbi:MAG: RNase J family beta-CASP ribonuclease [Clostridia bacterium]|nr:RNase J family beta-CASP ribonuclease [Clostridia bacterium]
METRTRKDNARARRGDTAKPAPAKTAGKTPAKTQAKAPAKTQTKAPAKRGRPRKPEKQMKISFLGGLNEIGKNMTVFEFEDDMFILDCGLEFPDSDMPGVDLVLADFTYVTRNADKIRGVVITHGHEDHIGGLSYLLKEVNVPVYATRLTAGLIMGKLKEAGIDRTSVINVIKPGDVVHLGGISVEAIHVNHSIPDSIGVAIKCAAATIVHTGDFKIDSTPIDGEIIDLARFAALGREGVTCLMMDSTNAERPGFTESEKKVGGSLEHIFNLAGDKRVIVATFASNIHRVQQIIDISEKLGRKVALSGRSLENVVAVASELGYLKVPEGIIITLDEVRRYTDDRITLITTGSQGEPMSALSRMATCDHRKVQITPNDAVIISATPIPGNEKTVGKVVDDLLKLGAEVFYSQMYDVHVSGHARQEELKLILGILKPRFFIPVHGERKHLSANAALGESVGIPSKNIILADNGTQITLSKSAIKADATVPAGRVFVDGYGVGDVGNIILRDRKRLSEDGLVAVSIVADPVNGMIITGPVMESRGFVYVKDAEELFDDAEELVIDIFERYTRNGRFDIPSIKNHIRDDVSRFMYERTKRSPIVVPIIIEM